MNKKRMVSGGLAVGLATLLFAALLLALAAPEWVVSAQPTLLLADDDVQEVYTVTFVYHDLEGVVPDGITLHVAGNFNGWSTTGLPMSGDSGVYTASVILDLIAPYALEFKIIAGDNLDNGRGDILNTDNREAVITAPTTLHLYRNISARYVVLNLPPAITINLGETTPVINGAARFSNIPFGTHQVLRAQIGYGTDTDPANWTWVEAVFSGRSFNSDVFTATLTPAAPGVYSYTIRFDGNWADTNPNSTWYLGDLTGVGPYPGGEFSLSDTGVLTVKPLYIYLPLVTRNWSTP